MNRPHFEKIVRETLDALPARFRSRISNVAVVVEDAPREPSEGEELLMGIFEGTPVTEKSVWDTAAGPDRIVLYQKNIEAVCDNEEELRREIRDTVLHEFGHFFGMNEEQLEDV